MKRIVMLLITVFVVSLCAQACEKKLDYGPAQSGSYIINPMSLEDYIAAFDALVVARCDGVFPKSPEIGYTQYEFTVIEVLGGDFHEEHFKSAIPRRDLTGIQTGTDEYELGKTYLIPLMMDEIMFEMQYTVPILGMSLCLSENRYIKGASVTDDPDWKTPEEAKTCALSAFNAVQHKLLPEKKVYSDEFEEFYEESAVIARLKAEAIEENHERAIVFWTCIELYKGTEDDLRYDYRKGGRKLVHVNARPHTVELGKEYIVGFTDLQISTIHSVKEVSDELIQKILEKNAEQ